MKKGAAGGWKTKLFDWALVVGQETKRRTFTQDVTPLAAKHALASRLVFSKWRGQVSAEVFGSSFRRSTVIKSFRTLSGQRRPIFRAMV